MSRFAGLPGFRLAAARAGYATIAAAARALRCNADHLAAQVRGACLISSPLIDRLCRLFGCPLLTLTQRPAGGAGADRKELPPALPMSRRLPGPPPRRAAAGRPPVITLLRVPGTGATGARLRVPPAGPAASPPEAIT